MSAERLGRCLGRWAWRFRQWALQLMVAGVRILIVAIVSAIVWHAIVPGMPVGAYTIVFIALSLILWPIEFALRAARRRVKAAPANVSGK